MKHARRDDTGAGRKLVSIMVGTLIMVGIHGWLNGMPATIDGSAGAAMFTGDGLPQARMRGHTEALPAEAGRCVNCHHGPQGREANVDDIAPALDRALLVEPVARRGGPPSRYDVQSFCRLLREGIDPAHVVIAGTMPRFDATDAQCGELWNYLTVARAEVRR